MRSEASSDLQGSIERHYDSLSLLYRTFWGEHIHHGLWLAGSGSPREARIRLVSHLAGRTGIQNGERVLDVGCGYGAPARWLADHLDCQVAGITISRKQARVARRENARRGYGARIAIVRADAAALPFADPAFDVVWVIECIEHLTDKQRFIAEVARLLRPGGRFALCSWLHAGDPAGDRLVAEVCDAFLCPSLATAQEYRSWCESAGLEIRCEEDLTPQVKATWETLIRRTRRPWLRPLVALLNPSARRFVEGFPTIAEAYESGAMTYGLLVAARPCPGQPLG